MENDKNVRVLRFKASQSGVGEDVYYCKSNKRHYIRQDTNIDNPPTVFWLSCTHGSDSCGWSGWEASAPLKAGLIMRAVDKSGNIEFEETIEQNSWDHNTHAIKKGKFSWEDETDGE